MVLTRRIGGASRAMFDPVIGRIRELASPGIMMSGPREEGALFGNIKPQLLPPGRGWLFTRRERRPPGPARLDTPGPLTPAASR